MDKKGVTKRQHYVPRFVLKKFSPNGKTFSAVHLPSGRVFADTPLKTQCYEDYFYGSDQTMEESFARSETEVASLLGDLSDSHLNGLGSDQLDKLRLFVHYQAGRTKEAVERQTEFIAGFLRNMALTRAELDGEDISPEVMEQVKLENPNEVNDSIWQTAKSTPIASDLDVRFLRARGDNAFVIGDHPVVMYNQFAEAHPLFSRWPSIGGLATMGLQLFMPLSSEIVLLACDPETYTFDSARNVCNVGKRDVMLLNSMQGVNARECVFFDPTKTTERATEQIIKARTNHPDVHRSKVTEIERRPTEKGGFSQIVAGTRNDIRLNARLSCLRVEDRYDFTGYDRAHVPVRSPELLAAAAKYGEILEGAVKERKSWDVLVREMGGDPPLKA